MNGLNRRSLITGLISLVAAPAIVRAGSLMPVKQMLPSRITRVMCAPIYFQDRYFFIRTSAPQTIEWSYAQIGWWVIDKGDFG